MHPRFFGALVHFVWCAGAPLLVRLRAFFGALARLFLVRLRARYHLPELLGSPCVYIMVQSWCIRVLMHVHGRAQYFSGS